MISIDMNMPKNCYECRISEVDNEKVFCPVTNCEREFYSSSRMSNCPLSQSEKKFLTLKWGDLEEWRLSMYDIIEGKYGFQIDLSTNHNKLWFLEDISYIYKCLLDKYIIKELDEKNKKNEKIRQRQD